MVSGRQPAGVLLQPGALPEEFLRAGIDESAQGGELPGAVLRSNSSPPSSLSNWAICMVMALWATNRCLAAWTMLPASTTSQKYFIWREFIFSEFNLKNQ